MTINTLAKLMGRSYKAKSGPVFSIVKPGAGPPIVNPRPLRSCSKLACYGETCPAGRPVVNLGPRGSYGGVEALGLL